MTIIAFVRKLLRVEPEPTLVCPAPLDTAWLQRNIDRVLEERAEKRRQMDWHS
jgi:hypothetical protein